LIDLDRGQLWGSGEPVGVVRGGLEFSERGADAIVDGEVGGEFALAAAQVLHESVSSGDGRQRADRFQSAHRSQPGFQPAVISFDGVVGVLLEYVPRRRDELIDDAGGRPAPGRW
jgi:hypothetical protein